MNNYEQKLKLYFELKNMPDSSKESYFRRVKPFIKFVEEKSKSIENLTESDIQEYILYLKREKELSPGTINNYISAHTLRHCFAVHALEDGVEPVFIKEMLGHKNLQTTTTYLQMTSKSMMGTGTRQNYSSMRSYSSACRITSAML